MAGNRLIDQLHFEACEKKLDCYVDPTSGYRVFTSQYLEKGKIAADVLVAIALLNIAT